jgi:hypothetical protein
MMEYFQVSEFKDDYRLSSPLSIIKSSIIKRQEALGDWVSYESEGYLEGVEALVLSIRVSVPSRSPHGILENEKIAICYFDHDRPLLKACALRKNFPDLPHLNLTPKGKPRELCLFDVSFMDQVYNQTFMDFVVRTKKWLDRAAVGELHLDEQPMEPFLMASAGDFVLDRETYERIIRGESGFEIFPTHFLQPGESTHRFFIEIGSKKRADRKNPFAILCIKSEPSSNQCISHRPKNYPDLYDLLHQKLSIDLDREIFQFIQNCYRSKNAGKTYLEKYLVLVLCISRLNSKGEIFIPEIVVFHFNKKLLEIGLAIGCLRQQARRKEKGYIYVLQDDFNKKEDELEKIQVDPLRVIRPFTKQLAMDMAGISERVASTSFSVIGLGALGSQLVLNLARQGISDWRLVDEDTLLPHNFARHALSGFYRGLSKAVALRDEISRILEEARVKAYPAPFKGFPDNRVAKIFKTDIILDCSASYSVFLDLAYRERPTSRTFSVYYCGEGYTSLLICEDSGRNTRLDDIDLQLKVKGLENHLIKTIYRTRGDDQLVYSTSCNTATAVIAQDLVAIHAGVLSRQIKKAIQNNNAQAFTNLIQEYGFGVQVENFIPSKVVVQDLGGWQFRVCSDVLDEMTRYRSEKLPNETGGVLIGWINSFKRIVYVGKALPAPPDSIERPYCFQRGKKGLYELVKEINGMSNGDLYYVGEWHAHPPHSSAAQSPEDVHCMEKISEFMLEDGLPGILLILGGSNSVGYHVTCGWEEDS